MAPGTAGVFSPYTVVLTVIIVLFSLVLAVVLFVLGFMGRAWPRRPGPAAEDDPPAPPAPAAPDGEPFYSDLLRAVALEEAEEAAEGAPDAEEPPDEAPATANAPPPRRKTGLWQLLAAILAMVPALLAQNGFESFYGLTVTFSWATFLNLLILAAQIFLTAWVVRLQKRLPPE